MPEISAPRPPLTETMAFRTTRDLRERIEKAAEDCGLNVAEWERFVVEGAVELHEEQMAQADRAAADAEAEDVASDQGEDDDEGPDPSDPGYAQAVEEAAQEARRQMKANRRRASSSPEAPPKLNPRDCPHLPSWRTPGGTCRRCRGRVATRLTFGR